jgi:putative alpha-1,2-mannosidase
MKTTELSIACLFTAALLMGQDFAQRVVEFADPFVGTSGDHGQTFPGAILPFGMVATNPDTYPSALNYLYLFSYLGQPWLTQHYVHRILLEPMNDIYGSHDFYPEPIVQRAFRATPDGLLREMDDDGGTMSAWFVLSHAATLLTVRPQRGSIYLTVHSLLALDEPATQITPHESESHLQGKLNEPGQVALIHGAGNFPKVSVVHIRDWAAEELW